MPCDTQNSNSDNFELLETLTEIETLINQYSDCEILWLGDLNWEMKRKSNFSNIFHNFVEKMGLKSAWEKCPTEFTHTHTDGSSTSLIDHFLVSHNLYNVIMECKPIHRGDNLSRHAPIILKVKLGAVSFKSENDKRFS